MKKKKIIILVLVLVVIFVFLFIFGSKTIDATVGQTTIFKGTFDIKYQTMGAITSNQHYVKTDYIEKCYVEQGQSVLKGDELFLGIDKRKYVSPIDGIVVEIGDYYVVINDKEWLVEILVPYEKYLLIDKNTDGLFISHNHPYNITLKQKYDLGIKVNNMVMYRITFDIEEGDDLLINQYGNVSFNLSKIEDVLLVDKKALLLDEEGYYLLDIAFKENYNALLNRIDINVLMMNEQYAYILGVGLENKIVCILDETTKEIIDDYN